MGRPREPSVSEGCYDTMRNPHLGIASPVLQRRHASKATEGNSGDQASSEASASVTRPISVSERAGEVASGVGEGGLQHFLEWKLRKYIAYKHQYRKASTHHTMGGALYQMGLSHLTGRIRYVYL
jgi:hypothetical protein